MATENDKQKHLHNLAKKKALVVAIIMSHGKKLADGKKKPEKGSEEAPEAVPVPIPVPVPVKAGKGRKGALNK